MPVNATMAVNINNIPSAALERVETITGGASSVYGADAIAGVVNFVLRRDFEGFDFDIQYGQTAESDAEEQRVTALMGTNFFDDRGNIMIGFEHAKRGELLRSDRAFWRKAWDDPTVNGAQFITTSGIRIVPTNPIVDRSVIDDIFSEAPPGSVSTGGRFYMNSDGTVFKREAPGNYRYNGFMVDPGDGLQHRKFDQDGQLDQNRTNIVLQLPLDRFSVFARGIMDVADNARVFGQMMFTDTTSEAAGPYTAHIGGWGASVPHGDDIWAPSLDANGNTRPAYQAGGPYGLDCPAVGGCSESQVFPKPPEVNRILAARRDPDGDINVWHVPNYIGNKVLINDISSYQFLAGVEGELASRDMTWEFYVSHGETHSQAETEGTSRLEGWRWLVRQPNYARGLQFTSNSEYPYNGFGAGTVYCETGYPVFYGVNGWGEATPIANPTQNVPSDDCIDTLLARVKDNSTMVQDVAELNLQGAAFDMPAGEARFAVGASYRKNDYRYNPDPLQAYAAVLDSAAGIYPVDYSEGRVSAMDIYGELLLPLYASGSQELNLELGYRTSDNEPTDTIDTHKALIDWRFTERVRFRGGIQKANRAPNVAELFQASEQQFYYTSTGDWCSTRNPLNEFSPNPNLNPNAAQAQAICESLMGVAGAQVYYGDVSNQSASSRAARWLNVIGNPNVHSEEADTTTAGVVVDVSDNITMTVDYWNIEISDMISYQDVEALWEECMAPDTNPTFDPTTPACVQLRPARDPTDGSQSPYFVTYTNGGAIDTAGWDISFDWSGAVGPGTMSVNFLASILDRTETRTSEDDDWTDWKGTDGPTELSGVQSFSYDYKTFTTVSYGQGPWTATLRWRHLPSIDSMAHLFSSRATDVPTNSYNMFDFAGRYTVSGRWDIRFGIDNLLDQEPELTFPDARTTAQGSTNPNFYDILGRRYYVGLNFGF